MNTGQADEGQPPARDRIKAIGLAALSWLPEPPAPLAEPTKAEDGRPSYLLIQDRVLAAIVAAPAPISTLELAAQLGDLSAAEVARAIQRLKDRGRVRMAGKRPEARGKDTALWGPGEHIAPSACRPPASDVVLSELRAGPMSTDLLVQRTGYPRTSIRSACSRLKERGLVTTNRRAWALVGGRSDG